ncbi:MAG: DUF11 domain-containing protein, partial [Chloroflexi bacterium]|nr:DUF11 domain-containing protein [Chloroflexota bacterium]
MRQSVSSPVLAIAQFDHPDPVPATWRIYYTIVVTNTGTTPLSQIVISDPVPAGTFFVEAGRAAVYEAGTVTWTVASLDPGSTAIVQLILGTFSTTRGPVTNTVTAAADSIVVVSSTETTTVIAPPTPTRTASATLNAPPESTAVGMPGPTATLTATFSPSASPTAARSSTPTPTATRTTSAVGTNTPRPTATQTAATPTLSPISGSGSSANLPPVVFVMLDWMNGDWGNPDYSCSYVDPYGNWQQVRGNPAYGALGGWAEFYWNELNPGRDVYNWTKIDQYIKKAQTMRVTLPDGSVIAKPVGISVAAWTTDHTATSIGVNRTPYWVAQIAATSMTSCYDPDGAWGSCKPFCTPNFANATWQYWFDQFVLAMGRRYDNNPEFYNLAFVNIATGVDGETSERKDFPPCSYFFGNSPAFDKWISHVMETYNQAFPHTVQFIQSTLHGIHGNAAHAASFPSRLTGVKVNGLQVDVPSAEVRRDGVLVGGVTGFSAVWHPLIPTGFEPKHGNGIEGSYWFFMEGLSAHPYVFDVQYQNIRDTYLAEQRTGFPILDFVRRHLGKTVEDTPDVW